ncbi:MAG: tRNA pseudouridine(38-40) synthase TruA [Pseudohongiellaceae bacterium]
MPGTETNAEVGHGSRIALGVEYDGSHFCGWQRQGSPQLPTVQGMLESALSKVADHPVKLHCAGRTDAGVHATGQVVHFDCRIDRGERAWIKGSNSQLPPTIRVVWAKPVSSDFHARFVATARRYLYILHCNPVASAIGTGQLTQITGPLNVAAMHATGQYLLGEQDFTAFQAAGCQSATANRCVHWLNVQNHHRFIVVDIQANAFLQHMVRNIVGMLLEVGTGRRPAEWSRELLEGRDRKLGAVTAPPDGLYLVKVTYPEAFALPELPLGPMFLQPYP